MMKFNRAIYLQIQIAQMAVLENIQSHALENIWSLLGVVFHMRSNEHVINGLEQDCGNSSELVMELL